MKLKNKSNKTAINSITTGPRQTNMELLRIIAMFMVLAVHANFYALGTPTQDSIEIDPLASATRIILCTTCCMCVNIFILISGWFSIRPSIKGFCKFAFQCLYFSVGIYCVTLIIGIDTFNLTGLAQVFFLSKWDWFIKAYIGLYIIAPALNALVEKTTQKQLKYFLISFYLFQTIYSIRGSAPFICSGYSTFSFIGLYILGRYLNINTSQSISRKILLLLIILPILITSTIYFFDAKHNTFLFSGMCMSYANPIMIVAAVSLMLLFANIKLRYNKFINFISASAFAAYLFHYDPHILQVWFCKISKFLFDNYDGILCISLEFLFLIVIFTISVILDQPRKFLWKKVSILIR